MTTLTLHSCRDDSGIGSQSKVRAVVATTVVIVMCCWLMILPLFALTPTKVPMHSGNLQTVRAAVDSVNAEKFAERRDTVRVEIPMGDSARIIVTPGRTMFDLPGLMIAVAKEHYLDMSNREILRSSVTVKDELRSFVALSTENWLTIAELRSDRIDTIGCRLEEDDSSVAMDVLPIDSTSYLLVLMTTRSYKILDKKCYEVLIDTLRIIENGSGRRIIRSVDDGNAREGFLYKSTKLHVVGNSSYTAVLSDSIRNVSIWNANVHCKAKRYVHKEIDSVRKRITLLRSWRCDDEVGSLQEYNECGIIDSPDQTIRPSLRWYGSYALSDSTVGIALTRWHETGNMEYEFNVINRDCMLIRKVPYLSPHYDEWLCYHMTILIATMIR